MAKVSVGKRRRGAWAERKSSKAQVSEEKKILYEYNN